VVAAVNFARENNLRLVIKGGGHSYQGTSDAPDSLLIWMREMSGITLQDAFVPVGCDATHAPQPAVTVETGARWLAVYDAVTRTLCAGRGLHDCGCCRVHSWWRIWQLFQEVRPRCSRSLAGGNRHG
jgi:FAD/FMN-containing dehydrogenase